MVGDVFEVWEAFEGLTSGTVNIISGVVWLGGSVVCLFELVGGYGVVGELFVSYLFE